MKTIPRRGEKLFYTLLIVIIPFSCDSTGTCSLLSGCSVAVLEDASATAPLSAIVYCALFGILLGNYIAIETLISLVKRNPLKKAREYCRQS